MAGSSGGAIDTGGGGLENQSAASATSGDITSRGDRAYGGINIAPAGGGFQLPTNTILIGVGLTALYFYAKKKNFI